MKETIKAIRKFIRDKFFMSAAKQIASVIIDECADIVSCALDCAEDEKLVKAIRESESAMKLIARVTESAEVIEKLVASYEKIKDEKK